jgi:hypothetical protein
MRKRQDGKKIAGPAREGETHRQMNGKMFASSVRTAKRVSFLFKFLRAVLQRGRKLRK